MDRSSRERLDLLLSELVSAQDDVTTYNVRGHAALCRSAKIQRDAIKRRICEFVESLLVQEGVEDPVIVPSTVEQDDPREDNDETFDDRADAAERRWLRSLV